MKIKRLRLQNIKSYQDQTITFYDGVNFISGVNGAGKSTIIESIGYALFDCKPGTLAEFVRYGAKTGIITVEFEAGDGCLYKVVRKLGSVSSWIVYDGESGAEIDLHGASDIKPWLKDSLGIEQEQDLAQLFNDVVGVSQGTFTAPFLETPANRKQKFNKMLKVEAFNEAYSKTREVVAAINRMIGEQEKIKVRLEERVADYERVKAEAEVLTPLIEELQQQVKVKKDNLAVKIKERDALRKTKIELEHILKKADITKIELENIEKRLGELQGNLVKAMEAAQKTAAAQAGYRAYLVAQKELAELEQKREARDQLTKRLADLTAELKAREAALEAEEKALQGQLQETAKAAADKLKQLQEKEAQVEEARAKNEELIALSSCLESFQQQLKSGEKKSAELAETRRRINDGLAKWTELKARIAETLQKLAHEAEVRKEAEGIKVLEKELEARRIALASLEQKLHTLEENQRNTAGGQCPFLHSPCQNVGGDLSKYFAEQIKDVKRQIEAENRQAGELADAIARGQSIIQALENLQKEQAALQHLKDEQVKYLEAFRIYFQRSIKEDLAETSRHLLVRSRTVLEKVAAKISKDISSWLEAGLEGATRGVERAWADYFSSVNSLGQVEEDSLNRLVQLLDIVLEKTEIFYQAAASFYQKINGATVEEGKVRSAALGRLLGEQQALQKQLADLDNKLAELEKQRQILQEAARGIEKLKLEQHTTEQVLLNYQEVDAEIKARQAVLASNQAAYETYMQHREEAERVAGIKAQLEAESRLLQEKQELYEGLNSKIQVLCANFREETLVELEKTVEELQIELAKAEQLLLERGKALQELQQKLLAMEMAKEEMAAITARIGKYQAAKELLEYIRSVFNRAGERVAAVYREYLAHEANRLYREVAKENVTLEWREDYELVLADSHQGRKRERSFRQLSGGEQMTAALAVRLALLGQLARVKLGFFDEPTTNLDVERRGNLAQIIPRITGDFDQLFVISHDDSFDAMTDNIIQLQKDQGEGTKLA